MTRVKIGIIGGTGLDDPGILKDAEEKVVNTPYGEPTSPLTTGTIDDVDIVILARHGKDHSIFPTGVNYMANIYALKKEGCSHIIATTAAGSLREEIGPGDLVFPDQFIDFTKHRTLTFFDRDKVVHTSMSDPFCSIIHSLLIEKAEDLGFSYHGKGTIITIEGPRFSTRAESHMFRTFGADIINMSTVPEVILAREAGICYQTVAMATDYDCWKEDEEPVAWDMIVSIMKKNTKNVKELVLKVLPELKYTKHECNAEGGALSDH